MATLLSISVTGIEQVLLSFNSIRIKRSVTGIAGVYELLTANAPQAATLAAPTTGPYNVSGKTLQLLVDQNPQIDVVFSGTDPLTATQVASQIDAAVGEAIGSDVASGLVLTSTNTGTVSKIEIVGGGAAGDFGWIGGERDIGEDLHVTLQTGVSVYNYTDEDGQAGYFYKAQFFNTTNNLASTDSAPFEGDVGTLVTSGQLSTVKVDLVDLRGIAVPGQEITFYPQHELLEVEGFQVALNRAPITIRTNNSGHAEVSLVRGSRVRVVFEGTSVIRDIVIPNLAETDLLSIMGTSPDPYDITELPFQGAIRRTL